MIEVMWQVGFDLRDGGQPDGLAPGEDLSSTY
jgi:hypothetical protein